MNTKYFPLRTMLLAPAVQTRPASALGQATPMAPMTPSSQGSSRLAVLARKTPYRRDWSALLAALLLSGICGHAQTYSIDWFSIDGGGGTSTGGSFDISGIVGQPDASPQALTGGNFSVLGGFWSLFAVQTPGAPLLSITVNAQIQAVIVSWPSPSSGFILQQIDDLNGTNWVAVSQAVTDDGAKRFIIVPPSGGNRFYRLFKP